jgi:hypothetical protein
MTIISLGLFWTSHIVHGNPCSQNALWPPKSLKDLSLQSSHKTVPVG